MTTRSRPFACACARPGSCARTCAADDPGYRRAGESNGVKRPQTGELGLSDLGHRCRFLHSKGLSRLGQFTRRRPRRACIDDFGLCTLVCHDFERFSSSQKWRLPLPGAQ